MLSSELVKSEASSSHKEAEQVELDKRIAALQQEIVRGVEVKPIDARGQAQGKLSGKLRRRSIYILLIWLLYCLITTFRYRISILPKCSLQYIVFASALPWSWDCQRALCTVLYLYFRTAFAFRKNAGESWLYRRCSNSASKFHDPMRFLLMHIHRTVTKNVLVYDDHSTNHTRNCCYDTHTRWLKLLAQECFVHRFWKHGQDGTKHATARP